MPGHQAPVRPQIINSARSNQRRPDFPMALLAAHCHHVELERLSKASKGDIRSQAKQEFKNTTPDEPSILPHRNSGTLQRT